MTIILSAAACDAQSVRCNLAEVAIIDRDNGNRIPTHYYRGEYWVAGRPGARYAIEVRNLSPGRLLAVMSVDGINVISGATAAWDQVGYVSGAGERYEITGWRKSNEEVAAFTFTDLPDSYAGRTGRPANAGVIGVAVFREREHQPVYVAPPDAATYDQSSERRDAPSPPAASSAPHSGAASAPHRAAAAAAEMAQAHRMLPAQQLGTGHGEREYSYVSDTDFQRLQSQPNDVLRIRYDSLQNLIAHGIVPRTHPAWSPANPFPDSERRFVPDPPG